MEKGTLKQWGAILGTAGTLLTIYCLTLPPSLTWAHYGDDGGDLATAVARGSIPHPPGSPTYLLLGELFIRLPWGNPAQRLNLMSAILAAGAAGLTTATTQLFSQKPEAKQQDRIQSTIYNPPSAICAGLCVGLSPLFWSQAIITEVYAPAAFFAALVMALSIRGGPAWALGLSWGAGLGIHPTLVFLAPLVARGIWKKRKARLLRLTATCLPALLGWGVLYGPVLLAHGGEPSPWGDVSTLDGWWALVSARMYHGYLFALPLTDLPQRLLAWVGLLARQFTPLGAVLIGLGMARLWQIQRSLVLTSALAFGAVSVYAIGYNTTDSLVYLAPALPLAALWLGVGLTRAARWLSPRLCWGAWAILALPLLQALMFWGQTDLSRDATATEWAEQVLHQAPSEAVLITERDGHTFTLWYARDVLGERPDVIVVDGDLWGQEPYRRQMADVLEIETEKSDLSLEEALLQTERQVIRAVDLAAEEEVPIVSREKRIAWALIILGLILFLVWVVRMAQIGLSLRKHLSQAQTLAEQANSPESPDIQEACSLVHDLRGDVVALRRQAGGLIQLAPVLGWLPKIGGDLRAAPHLLNTADGLTEAGALTCDAVKPALASLGSTETNLTPEQIIGLLTKEQASLKQALAATERSQAAWEQVDPGSLSPWLAGKVSKLDQGLPLLRVGLQAATVAPDLLGANEPRTYLILVQNDDELRPTGGYISGAGVITVEQARIVKVSFLDAYHVDDYLNKPYPAPPAPLLDYMGSEIWLFRDANWSPDFPTSARQAAYFYEYGQDAPPVDGVIALNQRAVELLLVGLDKVYVPDATEPVTSANVRQFIQEAWNPGESNNTGEWILNRKEFIGQLAFAILQRIEDDPHSVSWVQVAKGLYQALNERHLMIFVKDADTERVLAQIGWDGSLRESTGDYLMVVDTNIGFGKVNSLISERIDQRITLNADGTASSELTLTYMHQGRREDVHCQPPPPYTAGITYEALIHRCYYNYLRTYVPSGSVLRAATPHPAPGEYFILGKPIDGQAITLSDEAGKAVFAQFFVVEYGQTLTTHFEYDLPQVVQSKDRRHNYTLLIQKQAGTDTASISLTVVLPPGADLLVATPPSQIVNGDTLTFDLQLETDVVVEIAYK
jgi:hypothetical protein